MVGKKFVEFAKAMESEFLRITDGLSKGMPALQSSFRSTFQGEDMFPARSALSLVEELVNSLPPHQVILELLLSTIINLFLNNELKVRYVALVGLIHLAREMVDEIASHNEQILSYVVKNLKAASQAGNDKKNVAIICWRLAFSNGNLARVKQRGDLQPCVIQLNGHVGKVHVGYMARIVEALFMLRRFQIAMPVLGAGTEELEGGAGGMGNSFSAVSMLTKSTTHQRFRIARRVANRKMIDEVVVTLLVGPTGVSRTSCSEGGEKQQH
ncbi:karyopherin Kap123 [Cordyceps fumosorosea ARSEF 2679]|uniref:Karyopherin Kap123 n=1 Tax=Cordyceps fumosorosea (strain ARSEF 2679) TaxID=1081104 RepID=A0A167NBV2_CORFA|nr:karyopherin Kap123 [Cordyceps fumosorosea ARSEF 2679]OAA55371.1 karyopherin Kap123 [Cordyceps fumosorosea ARSEF 2679]